MLPVSSVARRRLDPHDVGAEVGEDPTRHRGRLAGEIDDAHAVEQRFARIRPVLPT